ncbi:MAG TPA: hypothetical protein VEC35_23185 [Noviherbaspirillum sp.]|nr:hypothetical protein [Noviherbaspirillum sp.]
MSYAWRQLQSAIRTLAGTTDRRDRLAGAYGKLIKLKPKDLPSEVAADHERLLRRISRFPVKSIPHEIRIEVDALSDMEVTAAIQTIMTMYDAVSAYQPQPVRRSAGARRAPSELPVWPVPALHILETRHGAFVHETA